MKIQVDVKDAKATKQRRSKLRFGIRDLIAAMTIAGLLIALLMTRSENKTLKEQLIESRPTPFIEFPLRNPVETAYASRFSIRFVDRLYPIDYEFKSTPKAAWKLMSISDGTTLAESEAPVDEESKVFQLGIGPNEALPGGFYVIEVTILDGDLEVTSQWRVIRIKE
ncbi:MAG: hypothetical protein AAGG48_32125 [Planctomycetota bacterium]